MPELYLMPESAKLSHDSTRKKISNWDYYHGDIFKYWIGDLASSNTPAAQQHNRRLELIFTNLNVVGDIVDRNVDGLLSKNPLITASGKKLETKAKQLFEKLSFISAPSDYKNYWFDSIWEKLVISILVEGVAYLRVTTVDGLGVVHCPSNKAITVNKRNGLNIPTKITYSYSEESRNFEEVQELRDGYLYITDTDPDKEDIVLSLDHLLILENRQKPIIDKSLIELENAIAHTATQINRLHALSVSRATIITNAELPKKQVEIGGQLEWVFDEEAIAGLNTPGAKTYIQGLPTYNDVGQVENYMTPGIVAAEVTNVSPFLDTINNYKIYALEKAKQSFILGQASNLSGLSRVEMRAEFLTSLEKRAKPLQRFIGQALSYALWLENPVGLVNYITIELQISLNKLSPMELVEIRNNYQAGLLSRHSAIALQNYVDPDMEMISIQKERQELTTEPATVTQTEELS